MTREVWTAGASAVIALGSLAVAVVTTWTLIDHGIRTELHYKKIVTPMVLADVRTLLRSS